MFHPLIYTSLFLLAMLCEASGLTLHQTSFQTLFSFGDSYTTQYLDLPSKTYPSYNDVSSTNGPNWVHYLTKAENWTDWDLAYNSAPIQNDLVHQQITELFPRYFLKENTWSQDKTLYGIWVGINDVGLVLRNSTLSIAPLMDRYLELITFLYKHNARNFLLINIPTIERSPKWSSNKKTMSRVHDLVKEFNQKLFEMAQTVSKFDNVQVFHVDAWSIFTRVLDNPGQSGFKNVTGYCPNWHNPEKNGCLPIDDYFWLNEIHATSKVHSLFANEIRQTVALNSSQ
ncbi:GDSL lipase/esterase [Chlamydoabsidia padenii]|nr:GDSL lipase/esterase [Chlamydoabsidia padenii]